MFARQTNSATPRSHRIAKQTCVLWIPSACGYLADFRPDNFRIVDHPSLACSYRHAFTGKVTPIITSPARSHADG